jgi:aldose 1-epimerase
VSATPSGEQWEIVCGEQRATVVEVGGGIREYEVAGRTVLEGYPREAMCDGAHGAPLIPWPNRLADGRYSFDGVDYQVELSEPARLGAIHGFTRWRPWQAAERERERVTVTHRLRPMPAYPFALDLRIEYALGEDGLRVSTTAENAGEQACPFGCGQHPYLSPGAQYESAIDECTLRVGAAMRLLVDEAKMIPVGSEPVQDTPFDFRDGRVLGSLAVDAAFTDLERGADGRAVVELTGVDGHCVRLWLDERYAFLQIYTGDKLAPARRRTGLAVEPMTCASNAFRSGDGLLRLEPGESVSATWGATLD